MSPRKASIIGGRWNNRTDCAHHGCSCCSAAHCWFLASFASSDCPVQPFLGLSHGGTRGFWPGECSSTLQLKPEAMPKIREYTESCWAIVHVRMSTSRIDARIIIHKKSVSLQNSFQKTIEKPASCGIPQRLDSTSWDQRSPPGLPCHPLDGIREPIWSRKQILKAAPWHSLITI